MKNFPWILIDTETTGFAKPIYVVEIAAQLMNGLEPDGLPFHKVLNHNQEIPPEAARVHGYTREILERDGEDPYDVYEDFREYAGDLPIVSYNLSYDFDDVLEPEWKRLGISPIGGRGFCALRLAQRLIDPVPAGNHKLQTLRQFYRLPERGAHTALGDVETVVDLMTQVLQPLLTKNRLATYAEIKNYAEEEFFPSRIAFGKFKGRDYRDALEDEDLMGWLQWLSESSKERTKRMGHWYLSKLDELEAQESHPVGLEDLTNLTESELEVLISEARSDLAKAESEYTSVQSDVAFVRSEIFLMVKDFYLARDNAKLRVEFREKYFDSLIREGNAAADEVEENFLDARKQTEQTYDEAFKKASDKVELSDDDRAKLKQLWKQLVRIYHPDRYINHPDQEIYEALTATINEAKETADIELLEEIATDTKLFVAKQGWGEFEINDSFSLNEAQRLYTTIQAELLGIIEKHNELLESNDYELVKAYKKDKTILIEIAKDREEKLVGETEKLDLEAKEILAKIRELDPTAFIDS